MKLPLGTWPADPKLKEIGAFFMLAAETGFEALGMAYLTRVLGMEVEDVNELLREIKKEMKNRKIHAYGKQYVSSSFSYHINAGRFSNEIIGTSTLHESL